MEITVMGKLEYLKEKLKGDVFTDLDTRILYSTDASAYMEMPFGVCRPANKEDVKKLIDFSGKNNITLIPRTAGTSLAGQVVGNGLVVDVSKYMTNILEFNQEEKWIRVEPGVVLDELNLYLAEYGLFFGPETSTSNRCMIGGMVGNNACGAHSLIYGSTRDHLLEVEAILSDGSEVTFKELTKNEFLQKCKGTHFENYIYKKVYDLLKDKSIQETIRNEFPDKKVKRRNTGYAIDQLIDTEVFSSEKNKFNFSKLIAGSEGTLAFITAVKLNLVPLPPPEKGLVCVHFNKLEEALIANLIALKYNPGAIELIDDVILECTKSNIEQQKNRFFIKGDPGAILVIEFARDNRQEIKKIKEKLENEMRENNYGYHFPLLFDDDIKKVWSLRKAGLGLLSNLPGDPKPVSVIEDTAVNPELLPDYVKDFKQILEKYDLECVYHAHIATGELHLRPVLNLKDKDDVDKFYEIARDTAYLVKKYRGSLSGEHGDGRLRGEFIPLIIGEQNYQMIKKIKKIWDPDFIFNKGKIIDTPRMNENLRYSPGQQTREMDTIFDFSDVHGILRMAEKCNGSGDCRKSELMGGTMCPSYMATKDEDKTTRARANLLREYLTHSNKKNPFDHKELYQILDLCLSCKGCKSECPSSVDMAKLKAEFLQHYYDAHHIPLRTLAIAYISKINALGAVFPTIFNFVIKNSIISGLIKKILGFAEKRSIPLLHKITFRKWIKRNLNRLNQNLPGMSPSVILFVDEFTNYNDTDIGIITIRLLNKLGYKIRVIKNAESGRTFLSKGLLRKASSIAKYNVNNFHEIVNTKNPLIGIEPSAILAFRDEYPDLLRGELKQKAFKLAENTFTIEEFIAHEFDKGRIDKNIFSKDNKLIKFHGHCQQKAIASTSHTKKMLTIPENYVVEEINSGCCGMAGSFGYEKEHYDLSMKVGELVLLPEVRKSDMDTIIVAAGTSCRHQIKDGTHRKALHPVEVLWNALIQ